MARWANRARREDHAHRRARARPALGATGTSSHARLGSRRPHGRRMTAPTRWPEARATRGLVATPHALASEAGVAVLKRGGHALGAAIPAPTPVPVLYPPMKGGGGDIFLLNSDGRRHATQ